MLLVDLVIGLFLIGLSIHALLNREDLAVRLADYHAQRKAWSVGPAWFRKRAGVRETRIMLVLFPFAGVGIGLWFVISAVLQATGAP